MTERTRRFWFDVGLAGLVMFYLSAWSAINRINTGRYEMTFNDPFKSEKAWLCRYSDGDSTGRILEADGMSDEDRALADTECPICGWGPSYHGCRWVIISDFGRLA